MAKEIDNKTAKRTTSDGFMPKKRVEIKAGNPKNPWNKKASHEQKIKEYQSKQDKMLTAHIKEIEKKKADATNIGWASGPNFIHSKTTHGKVYTESKEKNGGGPYNHTWDEE